jgi:hypothetical protein
MYENWAKLYLDYVLLSITNDMTSKNVAGYILNNVREIIPCSVCLSMVTFHMAQLTL